MTELPVVVVLLTRRIRRLAMMVRPDMMTVSVGKWGFCRNSCGGKGLKECGDLSSGRI
ncbi:hypothetical protein Hanom_Chr16g01432501 [Helianthus anomalus]